MFARNIAEFNHGDFHLKSFREGDLGSAMPGAIR